MPRKQSPRPLLDLRFENAFRYALSRHRTQTRKGTRIPYVAHLLQVTGLVLEAGGMEEEAIAALLHDALEDAPPEQVPLVRTEIATQFGERVLGIVEALSDAEGLDKPPWEERKRAYLERLRRTGDRAVLLVSCADKLHNATAIVRDLRTVGPRVWERFQGGEAGTLWYYDELTRAYRLPPEHPLLRDLRAVVAQLHELAGRAAPAPARSP